MICKHQSKNGKGGITGNMIKIEREKTAGFEEAFRGLRNSFNSWSESDSDFDDADSPNGCVVLGYNDLKLSTKLAKAGHSHAKFRRMIDISADVTAPLYWWKEYDTYKVGTVANSCSTMHTITDSPFTLADFSVDHLFGQDEGLVEVVNIDGKPLLLSPKGFVGVTLKFLNRMRELYLETGDKKYWWAIIQTLPTSYNQKRTIKLNYEVAATIYRDRKGHKLDEWHAFCRWLETLPYGKELICS